MKNTEFFHKRFSVGLTLDTTVEEFDRFLKKYNTYIENIYFSLPLGDKFHARENVVKQMRNPNAVKMFWEMLNMISGYDIKLELVLNNGNISAEDIRACKKLLDEHGIQIDLLGITDDIYNVVKEVFPTVKTVYSFKNRTRASEDFNEIAHRYEQIVLGRQNLRNTELFEHIKTSLDSKVVLLINNGCSHICGGCSSLSNCHSSYYRTKFNHDSEYIYALQSLMPFEIHSGMLDLSCVDILKISSRNASLEYLEKCLNSYIYCIEDEYISESVDNYLLWGRLAWHVEYYDEFSLDSIRKTKQAIYSKEPIQEIKSTVHLCLDIRDRYIFDMSDEKYDYESVIEGLKPYTKGILYTLEECVIGISNCKYLLDTVSIGKITDLINKLKTDFNKIYFELPPLTEGDTHRVNELLEVVSPHIDCIIANDWVTALKIREEYAIPVSAGEFLTFSAIESPVNDYFTDNDDRFGKGLINKQLNEQIKTFGQLKFLVCDMMPGGLCISKSEEQSLLVNLCHRNVALETCSAADNSSCKFHCLQRLDKPCSHIYSSLPWSIHCNSIREQNKELVRLEKTLYENRATFIISL